ncbi:MAG: alkaline phosphatase family protein [FCB group bacterium]|nr:alkaline phosphatase family protein [FCB group bacterium]
MNRKYRLIIWGLLLIALGWSQSEVERPYVLLISFDGFRADYLDWYDTPNFDQLAREGVKAKGMKPVFVSKTFPNHYSIATGMYAENHGLIANHFYDPRLDAVYQISNRNAVEDARFYGGEPIWVTAEKQGVKTASYYWVGTEAPIDGVQPSIWKKYDHSFPFEARIDSVTAWLQLPEEERPHLILLYFHEPDATGHDFGPGSDETREMVRAMDEILGLIRRKTQALPVYDRLNMIVLSDHGMAAVKPDQTIDLTDYVDLEGIVQEGSGPTAFLYGGKRAQMKKVYEKLKQVPHLTIYRKNEIPERLHYKHNYRIKDFLLIADEGWVILDSDQSNRKPPPLGTHGYDNNLWSMHAIFLADGPAFRDGYERTVFENVNVYPLIARILGLKPYPRIDGKLKNVEDLLRRN